VKRREVVAVLGAVAVAPFAALGQQRKLRTIGYLSSNPPDVPVGEVAAFREGLGEAGVVEGRDAAIEYRFAEGKYDRLTRFAAELVTHNVDVIAASGLPAAVAAKSATAKIPIVFTVGVDPVAQGLVESLNRPGGNLTEGNAARGDIGRKAARIAPRGCTERLGNRLSYQPDEPERGNFEQNRRRRSRKPRRQDHPAFRPSIRTESRPLLPSVAKGGWARCCSAAMRFFAPRPAG